MTEEDTTGKSEASIIKDSQPQIVVMRLNRGELLAEDIQLIPDLQDRAFRDFFKTLALEPHIQGVAFLRTNHGGICTNIFIRNFTDYKANERAGDVVDDAIDLLALAIDQPVGAHDYIATGEEDINDFAEWFKKEFYTPLDLDEEDKYLAKNNVFFSTVRGSSEDSDLVRIVVFED